MMSELRNPKQFGLEEVVWCCNILIALVFVTKSKSLTTFLPLRSKPNLIVLCIITLYFNCWKPKMISFIFTQTSFLFGKILKVPTIIPMGNISLYYNSNSKNCTLALIFVIRITDHSHVYQPHQKLSQIGFQICKYANLIPNYNSKP